ncbi:PHA-granule associated protein 4 [Cupriavidus basilensis]
MTTARAETKGEASRLLEIEGVALVELDYESAWQDASELSHLGVKTRVGVKYRGHESVAVESPAALAAGLKRPKLTFRQRNLYCLFALTELTACELTALETKAMKMGDYILAGHLLRDTDSVWAE